MQRPHVGVNPHVGVAVGRFLRRAANAPTGSRQESKILRPDVEEYVLHLTAERTFRKSDFAELRDGHVRVLSPLSHELAETVMPMCARAVAPHAEGVTHALQELIPGRTVRRTPLTSTRRRKAAKPGALGAKPVLRSNLPPATCKDCGGEVDRPDYRLCKACRPAAKARAAEKAAEASRAAHAERAERDEPDPSHSPETRRKAGRAIAKRDAEAAAWDAAHPGVRPDPSEFGPIAAGLRAVSLSQIAARTGLSKSYAGSVRSGKHVPHPRHWRALSELADLPCPIALD